MIKQSINALQKTKFLLTAIASITLLSIGFNEAYAGAPDLETFVADDPDNRDTVYSNDDIFTISFRVPINVTASATMSQGAIDGNFTQSGGASFGTTYSGQWSADRLTLIITVTNVAGATDPIIGTTTISALGTSNLGIAGAPPTSQTLNGTPLLSGDYGLAGGGSTPKGGYQPPTMGITKRGLVLVEDGFSYNNNPVDVALMNTPYPLVTTSVGGENVAKLKIYSPRGIDKLQHAAVAFGLDKHEIFGKSNVVMEWDKLWNGEETLTVVDPENYLDNVRIVTSEGKCRESGNDICLIVEFYHTFRKPLDYNIIGTYIWDNIRSGWQNYYNDGVEIVGDSLDPPAKHQVNHKGKLIQITETGKNAAIGENGNNWFFDKSWQMEYVPSGKIDDDITSHLYDRNHVKFNIYQKGQELIAKNTLTTFLNVKLGQNDSLIFTISNESKRLQRSEDIELQNRIEYEKHRSELWFADNFVINKEGEFNKYLNIYQKFHEQND